MKAEFFRSREAFMNSDSYCLLPFRFMRWSENEVLLSNDVGEWAFLPASDFQEFVQGHLSRSSQAYSELKAKHLLADSPSTLSLQLLATKYRTKKSFLDGFTRLHIFVVTLRCD